MVPGQAAELRQSQLRPGCEATSPSERRVCPRIEDAVSVLSYRRMHVEGRS